MVAPTKPVVPTSPVRSDKTTFDPRVNSMNQFWQTMSAFIDTMGGYIDDQAVIAEANASAGPMPSFAGHAEKYLRINATATNIEFAHVADSAFVRTLLKATDYDDWRSILDGANAYEKIEEFDAAGLSSFEFLGLDPTKYSTYILEVQNLIPSSEVGALYYKMTSNGGLTYWGDGAGEYYDILLEHYNTSGTLAYVRSAGYQYGILSGSIGKAAGEAGLSGTYTFYAPDELKAKMLTGNASWTDTSGLLNSTNVLSGSCPSPDPVNGIKLMYDALITSGTLQLYGLRTRG